MQNPYERASRPRPVRYVIRRKAATRAELLAGGGTTAIAAWQANRRSTGGDVNPHAIRFTAARLLLEHAWPADRQPSLLCA